MCTQTKSTVGGGHRSVLQARGEWDGRSGGAPQGDVDEPDQHRDLDERADDAGEGLAEATPKAAMATAMASSKLLPAAVKASVVVRG